MIASASVFPGAFVTFAVSSALVYVLLASRALGLGILCPLVARRADTGTLFTAIAPFWDAREAWLILGAMTLRVSLPSTFAAVMALIHIPLLIMVICLLLRAATYALQGRITVLQRLLQWMFFVGSILAALCQGWIFGLLVDAVTPQMETGSMLTIVRKLFPFICGIGAIAGYALLGCCWLIVRTRAALQVLGREVGLSALISTSAILIIISTWQLIWLDPAAHKPWIPSEYTLLTTLVVLQIVSAWQIGRNLWSNRDGLPLAWASLLVVAAVSGIVANIPPVIGLPGPPPLSASHWKATQLLGLCLIVVLPFATFHLSSAIRTIRSAVIPDADPASLPHVGARRTAGHQAELHLS